MTVTKFGNPIRVGSAASDPTAENGAVYYNSADNILKFRENGAFRAVASREYADAIAAGFSPKNSVRLGTVAVLPDCTYDNGASGVGATLTADNDGALSVDGTAVAPGDRILVKDQVAGLQNGIYVVTDEGDGSSPFVLTRSSDFDDSPDGEVSSGAITLIVSGSSLGGQQWFLTTAGAITLGTTALVFSQASGGGGVADLQEAFDADPAIVIADNDNRTLSITNNDVTNGTQSLEIVHNNSSTAMTIDHNASAGSNPALFIDAAIVAARMRSNHDNAATLTLHNQHASGYQLALVDADNTNNMRIRLPNLSTDIDWTLPSAQGGAGTVLTNNGSGALTWETPSSGAEDLQEAYEAGNTILTDSGNGDLVVDGTETLFVSAAGGIRAVLLKTEDGATSDGMTIRTGDGASGLSGNLAVITGTSSTANSGGLDLRTGDATGGNGGDILMRTGDGDLSGSIYIGTGPQMASTVGSSGDITMASGPVNEDTLVSGSVLINTGDSDHATGGDSGNLTMRTGESVGANSGNITISTGDASNGVIGNITIASGSGSSGGDITATAAQNLSLSSGNDVNISSSNDISMIGGNNVAIDATVGDIDLNAANLVDIIGGTDVSVNAVNGAIYMDASSSSVLFYMNDLGSGDADLTAAGRIGLTAGNSSLLINDGAADNIKLSTGPGGSVELFAENGVHRSGDDNEYVREDYVSNFSLTASTTAVAAELTFESTNYEGALIDYKIKEATTGRVRVGQLVVATNGTAVVVTDVFAETADVGVSWAVAMNGTEVELSYTTTANTKTMQADIKKIGFVA